MKRFISRWWVAALLLFILNHAVVSSVLPPSGPQPVDIPYTLFKQQVGAGNVAAITTSADTIQGRLKQPVSFTPSRASQAVQVTDFATVQPTFADPGLETLLEQQGVVVNATPLGQTTPWWLNLLLSFGPVILLIGGFVWLTRRAGQTSGGGLFGIGRSRAKRYDRAQDQPQRITFNDVAGIDEAKAELEEIVDFLKDPRKYTRLGGTVPRGVLLVGPPGTGKTLLARAVAGEAKVPFFSMGASEFVEIQMVTRWGMSEKLGPVALAPRNDDFLGPVEGDARVAGAWRSYSEETARLIDAEVRRVLDESYADATRLLRQRRPDLDALAMALLERETLDEQEILQVTGLQPEPRIGVLPLPVPVAAFSGKRSNA